MVNQSLVDYITKLRSSNVSDEIIKAELLKNGWLEADVQEALAPIGSTAAVLPPPPVPRFSMWISFQYVLLFVTLWVWSTAMGGVWHYAINKHIADSLAGGTYNYMSYISSTFLQGYLAAIIVAFPFFVILFLSLKKQVDINAGVRNIKTRKFLFYFTIVVNFLYMISQLIVTVIGFLGATMSARTVPNLIVNLLIPGAICIYLLTEVKEDRGKSI